MRRHRSRLLGAIVLVAAMLAQGGPALAAPPRPVDPAADRAQLPPREKPLHGQPVPVKAAPAAPAKAPAGATPVIWPAAGEGVSANQAQRAGALPVYAGAPRAGRAAGTVRVRVLDHQAAVRDGMDGVLLTVAPQDGKTAGDASISLDYSGFRGAYGGDWAARLQFERLPDCAVTTPDKPECRRGTPVATTNDATHSRLTADVQAAPAGAVYAATAAPAGSTGDYTATKLSPASTWDVSTQSGDFSTAYPFRVPQVPGGLVPTVKASYSSNAVDGHTSSTNNQPSWLGEGWSLLGGVITRAYKSCASDTAGGSPKTGDLCWGGDNAVMTLNGRSNELVREGNGPIWHLRADDGTRVEQISGDGTVNGTYNGEHWKVTTPEGVQYFFGLNRLPGWQNGSAETHSAFTVPVFGNDKGDPCHNDAGFAQSVCTQANQWNLDYVADPHGDAISYFYQPENNSYGENLGKTKADYVRGGTLSRIEYGTRAGSELSGKAPAVVTFDTADRCAAGTDCGQHVSDSWPDVPWDRQCDSGCTDKYSPSFFSTKRLAKITTKVLSGTDYREVEHWTFDQSYPDPGDGSGKGLWLDAVNHAGGADSTPPVTYEKVAKPNRINTPNDGLPPLNKFRIGGILNETGGHLSVTYFDTDCDPNALPAKDANTRRCFPTRWAPPNSGTRDDWFIRYAVSTVVQEDRVGGSANQTTSYTYPASGGAWAYNDDPLADAADRTWSQWRGYDQVITRTGDPLQSPGGKQSETEYRYFRGMNGDHLANGGSRSVQITDSQGNHLDDNAPLAGFTRETITRDGAGGAVVTDVLNDAYQRGPTATQGSHQAYQVANAKAVTRTALDGGAWRTTEVDSTYDDAGNVIASNDLGDVAKADDDKCVRTTYVGNGSIRALPSRVETVSVACTAKAVYPDNAVSDLRTYYDGGNFGDAPTKGDVTKKDRAVAYPGGVASYAVSQQQKFDDDYGRVTESTDAVGRVTKTSYGPVGQASATSVKTDPMGFTTTTTTDPAWNASLSTVDANNVRTDLQYDGLGRLSAVWKPGRDKGAGDGPTVRYHYLLRTNGASSVSTETLKANGNYVTSYALYDGFLRDRETQTPAWGGGRIVTEKYYDSRGLVTKTNNAYPEASPAGSDLVSVADGQVPSQTLTTFDGTGRQLESKAVSRGTTLWTTKNVYHGDHTDLIPPAGGTTTSTYTDGRGRKTELRQYHGGAASGDSDSTHYTYTATDKQSTVTDPAGNAWTYAYDLDGNTVHSTDPDKGATDATFDLAGQQLTTKDARGQVLAYEYDALGRKTAEHRDSVTGPVLASWAYDTLAKGKPTSATRFSGGNAYITATTGYDAAGRPTGSSVTIPAAEGKLAGTYTTSIAQYMADGSVGETVVPALGDLYSSEDLLYYFDDMGLPSATEGAAKYVTDTQYTPYGELASVRFGDQTPTSLWQSTFYDDATRKVSKSLVTKSSVDGVVVQNTDYGYDLTGNVTTVAERMGGETATDRQCFGYDYLRRLADARTTANADCANVGTSAGGPYPYWDSYTFDPTGNRTTETQHGIGGAADTLTKYTYPPAKAAQPHTVQSAQTGAKTDTYGYTEAGQTKARPGQTLTWDPEGKLASVASAQGTEGYLYDANGNLLISRDSAGATLSVPSGQAHVDKNGKVTGTRYYSQGATRIGARTAAGLSYLFADNHGTDSLAVDAATLKVTKRRFDPFGDSRDAQPVAWTGTRGFVGGTTDSAADLTTVGARQYDAGLGRFLSADPVFSSDDPQAMNDYAYADNNPVTMADPSGKAIACTDDGYCIKPTPTDPNHCYSGCNPAPKKPAPAPAPTPAPKADCVWQWVCDLSDRVSEALPGTWKYRSEIEFWLGLASFIPLPQVRFPALLFGTALAGMDTLDACLGHFNLTSCLVGGAGLSLAAMGMGPVISIEKNIMNAAIYSWRASYFLDVMGEIFPGTTKVVETSVDVLSWVGQGLNWVSTTGWELPSIIKSQEQPIPQDDITFYQGLGGN